MTLWSEYLEDLSDQPWVDEMVDTRKGISMDGKIYGLPLISKDMDFCIIKIILNRQGITEVPDNFR